MLRRLWQSTRLFATPASLTINPQISGGILWTRLRSDLVQRRICPGCGSLQTDDASRPGYIREKKHNSIPAYLSEKRRREDEIYNATMASLDERVREMILPTETDQGIKIKEPKEQTDLCSRCHSLLHHSSVPSNVDEEKASSFDVYSTIRQDPDALVVNVIDVMDFPLSLLSLRKHIGTRPRIIHVFSRTDVLFKKPFTREAIAKLSPVLQDLVDDRQLDIRVISALKGWEIAGLANSLRRRRKGTNIYFIGSANAGKSSLIATLGRRSGSPPTQLPIVSHLPGTTLASVPTRVELFGEVLGGGQGSVVDLPGILKPGFASLIKPRQLQKSLPHKYINARPIGLKPGQSLLLGDLIHIENIGHEHLLLTPYMHLDAHKTSRPDYMLEKSSETRIDGAPAFETAIEEIFDIKPPTRGGENIIDLVFKDIGFVGVALWKGQGQVKVRTPGGQYAGVRYPALIRNSYEPEEVARPYVR